MSIKIRRSYAKFNFRDIVWTIKGNNSLNSNTASNSAPYAVMVLGSTKPEMSARRLNANIARDIQIEREAGRQDNRRKAEVYNRSSAAARAEDDANSGTHRTRMIASEARRRAMHHSRNRLIMATNEPTSIIRNAAWIKHSRKNLDDIHTTSDRRE